MPAQPPLAFIIYAREDAAYCQALKKHLAGLVATKQLAIWSDSEISPGEAWDDAIKQNLKKADLVFALISADFAWSDYIQNVEMQEALERHNSGEARILPILVRHFVWQADPVMRQLQLLPKDGLPVNDPHWGSQDKAWVDVVHGVSRTLEKLRAKRGEGEAEAPKPLEAAEHRQTEQQIWQTAQQTDTPEALGAYLDQYPKGTYAAQAKKRLQDLKHAAQRERPPGPLRPALFTLGALLLLALLYALWPAPDPVSGGQTTAESADWTAAQQANTIPTYKQFLNNNPNDPRRAEAETRLSTLQEAFDAHRLDAHSLLNAGLEDPARTHLDAMLVLWPGHPNTLDARNLLQNGMPQAAANLLLK